MYSWEALYLMVDKNLALLEPRAMKLLAEMRAIEAIAAILTMLMLKLQREAEQSQHCTQS